MQRDQRDTLPDDVRSAGAACFGGMNRRDCVTKRATITCDLSGDRSHVTFQLHHGLGNMESTAGQSAVVDEDYLAELRNSIGRALAWVDQNRRSKR